MVFKVWTYVLLPDSLPKADQKFDGRQSFPLDLTAEALRVVMVSEAVLEDINQVSFCL